MGKQLLELLCTRPFSIISAGLIIDEADGNVSLINSKEFHYIRPSFSGNYYGTTVEKTKRIHAIGAELKIDATFEEMFGPLSDDKKKIAFTEHQIVNFIRRNRAWMNAGSTTYFPFKYLESVYVAAIWPVERNSSFGIDVHRMDEPTKWPSHHGPRIVIPWLEI